MPTKPMWRPTHADPVLLLSMDHRAVFGKNIFSVEGEPTPAQSQQMCNAKSLIYSALATVHKDLPTGRAAVRVDERYGKSVIEQAKHDGTVLAIPLEAEASGEVGPGASDPTKGSFTLEWGEHWLDHVEAIRPDYAKVLVHDNPGLNENARQPQLQLLARVSAGLDGVGVPLLIELLVPATIEQTRSVDDDSDRYNREIRPELTRRLIADHQAAGVNPVIWELEVEGMETPGVISSLAAQAHSGHHPADIVMLGRDAPIERLDHWIDVAAGSPYFVGFAIGRSIWEGVLREYVSSAIDEQTAKAHIAEKYMHFVQRWNGQRSARR